MVRIGTNSNTIIPCFQVIKSKGYSVSRKIWIKDRHSEFDDSIDEFTAEKDGVMFIGNTLEETLGLIAMWEYRGKDKDNWQANNNWRANQSEYLEYKKCMDENSRIFDNDGNHVDEDSL